ncbi:hypothetical protein KP509_16G059900 [Ceratopteris richardii]|uniref:Ribulose bisphosphate carboxylase large chain n=1 Tax=Ceratopteris richardii TaxID=49495 RepID=A0A8T2T015_CERRI|nr:hypothetical protein KP509_16G059900 [Ceratopteris richardii]
MLPQTETKACVGFQAGVKDYRLTYYTPEVLAEEAGAAVAAESSTGTWTTENQYIAYVAYPLDLFEEGYITNMLTSIVGNVFGFKALCTMCLEDLRIPPAYSKTFLGPPHGIQVERDKLNKYGRPLLGLVYECLRGGLDFTKDDENVNSQPFMHWRDCFCFVAEALYKAQNETGEIKGHYLNATTGTTEEMLRRVDYASALGAPIIMHDYLTGGFTANTSLAIYSRNKGLLLHIHQAMHAFIDRQRNHGMYFCVLAKALLMSRGDHIHAGTEVGKLEDHKHGIYFTQDWVSMPGVIPVASGGIHIWHMPALTKIFGDDSVLQFGGGTLKHPWGNAPGAIANYVALEACVQAHNEGRDLAREGNEIIHEGAQWSPELTAACEIWKAIKFEFDIVDVL